MILVARLIFGISPLLLTSSELEVWIILNVNGNWDKWDWRARSKQVGFKIPEMFILLLLICSEWTHSLDLELCGRWKIEKLSILKIFGPWDRHHSCGLSSAVVICKLRWKHAFHHKGVDSALTLIGQPDIFGRCLGWGSLGCCVTSSLTHCFLMAFQTVTLERNIYLGPWSSKMYLTHIT